MTPSTSEEVQTHPQGAVSSISSSNNLSLSPNISSLEKQNANEILIYCQNFNRMKSPGKMKEISLNLLSHSFDVILGTETNWDESVHPEEIFGNNYFVFQGNRNLSLCQKKSGGGVLIAIDSNLHPKEIEIENHFQFEQVWAKPQFQAKHTYLHLCISPQTMPINILMNYFSKQ